VAGIATAVGFVLIWLFAYFWMKIRPTEVVFPSELTEKLEAEEFRAWLTEPEEHLIWGRHFDGRYFIVATGWLHAREIRSAAFGENGETTRTP
jgi:hypothetical protein